MNRNLTVIALAFALLFSAGIATAGVTDRDVITQWWVIFNNPAECGTSPCGEADFFVPEVEASVLFASGTMTGNGNLDLVASMYENDDSALTIDGNTSVIGGPGLLSAHDAEIHLVVRNHGPAIPGIVDQQLTEYMDPGCSDAGGPNTCFDEQYTIFMAGDEISQSVMYRFADGSVVEGSRVMLVRQDGVIKSIMISDLD